MAAAPGQGDEGRGFGRGPEQRLERVEVGSVTHRLTGLLVERGEAESGHQVVVGSGAERAAENRAVCSLTRITLDTYSHTIPAMEADAAEAVAGIVFGRGS